MGTIRYLAKILSPFLNVHAVEALEKHRKYFYENIEINQLHLNDFNIHPEGIAPVNGRANLIDKSFGSSIISGDTARSHLDQIQSRGIEVKPVDVITLDALIERIGTRVDLVQMDIQGLELHAPNSGINSIQGGLVSTFLIGTHSPALHQGCIDFLKARGYRISFEIGTPAEQPDGIIIANNM